MPPKREETDISRHVTYDQYLLGVALTLVRGYVITPRAGDLLQVGRQASVQFSKPILFRVIRVLDRSTYHGWLWLDGYQINDKGDAVARRSIFVQQAGLRPEPEPSARLGRSRVSRAGAGDPGARGRGRDPRGPVRSTRGVRSSAPPAPSG
ncbi:hypothetical protein GCM10011608_14420 [Micromonospora sonchi]|uniref:Uncharacterized protein n=1 Tax=Micromonospora sonchi TaxID=1763543 RepID=A0A917TNR6_9ACTN|nr:hypothetical protein GCM10011608_14420 [Micromonospora sonchi]